MVLPDGGLLEVTEDDPELLQVTRSSYGLFGSIRVTFRVRRLEALQVYHQVFSMEEFARQLPALKARNQSMMMYMNPFLDSITIEFRRYGGLAAARALSTWQWKVRDFVWSRSAPLSSHLVSRYVPLAAVRGFCST
jgi:hypothetical protein